MTNKQLAKKIKKGGENKMMKKILGLVLIAVCAIMVSVGVSHAADNDDAYVVVRCTITASVLVGDNLENTTWYVNASTGVAPGETWISPDGTVTVENDSAGAIEKWFVCISTIEICDQVNQAINPANWSMDGDLNIAGPGYWKVGAAPGINTVALSAVFCSDQATAGDFDAVDVLSFCSDGDYTKAAYTYQANETANRFQAGDNNYASAIVNDATDINYVGPSVTDGTPATSLSVRELNFMLQAPTAVYDQHYRRIVVRITGQID